MSFANVCPPFVHQLEGSSKGARLRVYANPLSGGIMEDTGATKPEGTTRGPGIRANRRVPNMCSHAHACTRKQAAFVRQNS